MISYRLYFLESGHIRHAVPFECQGDDEADGIVQLHADGRPMELWSGPRMVRSYGALAAPPRRAPAPDQPSDD